MIHTSSYMAASEAQRGEEDVPEWEKCGGFPPWDSFRHYSELRVNQFGTAMNVAIVVGLAFLGLASTHLLALRAIQPRPEGAEGVASGLGTTIVLLLISTSLGVLLTFNRLLDFRATASVARMRWSKHALSRGRGCTALTLDRGKSFEQLDAEIDRLRCRVDLHGKLSWLLLVLQLLTLLGALSWLAFAVTGNLP